MKRSEKIVTFLDGVTSIFFKVFVPVVIVLMVFELILSLTQEDAEAETSVISAETQLEEENFFNKRGFGETYTVYTLENSNNVIYQLGSSIFLLGENTPNCEGHSYFDVYLETDNWKEPVLKKVSSEYLVFSVNEYTEDSKKRELLAIETKQTPGNFVEYFHVAVPYDQLSTEAKANLKNVVSIETVENQYDPHYDSE